ncbi:MAG TPA: sulfatase-like hydrolase/transferase [Candidatus Limnocylindrales bacterium]|nr:sulfatase-like hydrolase/transferase [Candidatus Limnocylindrales bacterium]
MLLACVCRDGEEPGAAPSAPEGIEVFFTDEKRLAGQAVRHRMEAFAPEAMVGVTVYASALARRLRLGVPMWADVFGDLLSEAQAKAARSGGDWSLVHFWSLLAPVLETADRFSAVSHAHSHALIGQLGLAGRLSAATAGENLVEVIPCAAEAPAATREDRDRLRRATRRELGIPENAFVALCSGGFNTWCDVDTLGRATADALARDSRMHVVVTGGAIPGHDEHSYGRFLELAGSCDRVHLLGWVDSPRLPAIYACADVGLNIELPLYERRFGAENRVVEWLAHGLPCLTTALSEAGAVLVEQGLAVGCARQDPESLAQALLELAAEPSALHRIGDRGRRHAAVHASFTATAAPLLQWAEAPAFAGDHEKDRLLRLGLLTHPQGSTEMLEAYVRELSTLELMRRGLRWTLRRAFGMLGSLAAAAVLMTQGGCNGAPQGRPHAPEEPPNILFLSIDTLRADHMGMYGYDNPTTPWMDDLAARGTVVEHAIASAPETAPAVATLLTGVYQDRHAVAFNRANLPDKATTIAEILAGRGYSTAAFIANRIVDDAHGFGQGFERFEVAAIEPPATVSTDDRVVALALGHLRTAARDRPWFLWVHLLDPHGPYNSAQAWWSKDFQYPARLFGEDPELEFSDSNFGLGVIPRYQVLEGQRRLSYYVRRYDGDIRFTDHQVGALLGGIERSGHRDTLVVLTADHGESLTEHQELLQHGWFLYDSTVRVPLVFTWPGQIPAGARIRTQACTVDIVPTLLDLIGVDPQPHDFDGTSLAGELRGGDAPAGSLTRDCFAIGPRPNHPFALRSGGLKMIVTPAGAPSDPRRAKERIDSGRPPTEDTPERRELYDLAADPGETRNIVDQRRDDAADLAQRIAAMRARFRSRGWRW